MGKCNRCSSDAVLVIPSHDGGDNQLLCAFHAIDYLQEFFSLEDKSQVETTSPKQRIPEFQAILTNMQKIHEVKNHDYASDDNSFSNFEFSAFIGSAFQDVHISFAVLIGTKLARLAELLNGKTPKNESIADTFTDLAVYAVLWQCYWLRIQQRADPAYL